MTKRAPTIRSKLVLLVTACVLPASLMAVVLITHDYQRTRELLLTNLMGTARAMVSVVDRDMTSIESSLVALGTSPYLANRNYRAFYHQAQSVLKIQAEQGDINIALLDLSGRQYINTRRPFGTPLPSRSRFKGIEAVFDTGKPVISDLFVGEVTRRPLLVIGVPISLKGVKVDYSLNAGIFPERFQKLLLQQKLPEGWIAAIFDGNGNIIARTRDMQHYVGKPGTPEMIRRMSSTNEDTFISTTHDGVRVHTVFSRSSISNWSLAIGIPTQSITDELRYTLFWLIFATIALLASSLTAAWLIGGRIAESIHGLTGPALALGSGEVVSVPPLHLREADEVGDSLVRVSEMLHRAQHQANHDVLTGLANRALFNEIVNQQLLLCERNNTPLAILYIDLDGFKSINDRHGHETGDKLLCNVAARLKGGSRNSDVVARLGGDEFAVVMVGASMHDGVVVGEKLVDSVSAPYLIDGLDLHVSASIGVSAYPDSGVTSDALLSRADVAMYRAKEMGRRQVAVAT